MSIFTSLFLIHWKFSIMFQLCGARSTTPRTEQSQEEMIKETCLQVTGYTPLDDNITFFRVMEVVESSNVSLPCSFCGETTEDSARIWLWKPRTSDSTARELELGLAPTLEDNRLFTFPNHSLTIHNVTIKDTGIYYCRSPSEDDGLELQFSLDLVKPQLPVIEEKTTTWSKYQSDIIESVNKRIYESREKEMESLLDTLKVRVSSEWDPWLPCDGCAGLRRRYAKCRIRTRLSKDKYPDIRPENLPDYKILLHRSVVVSCHSQDLAKWFPHLYSLTETVPNFLKVQTCYDSCVMPDRQPYEAPYRVDMKMEIGSSMSFVCPNSDLKTKVVWKKDWLVLKPLGYIKPKKPMRFDYRKPKFRLDHAFVDRLNVLQLCLVTSKETAVYLCYVNNLLMKSFNITVVSGQEAVKQRRYYFWMLFLYTSLLSTLVVIIGLCHGFISRDKFYQITQKDIDKLDQNQTDGEDNNENNENDKNNDNKENDQNNDNKENDQNNDNKENDQNNDNKENDQNNDNKENDQNNDDIENDKKNENNQK